MRIIEADPILWPPEPTRPGDRITTARCVLAPIAPDDAMEMTVLADDWLVAREAPSMPYPYDLETARRWIAAAVRGKRRGTDHIFTIRRRADGRFLGAIGLQVEDDGAEIGYWLGRAHWGQGLATEAVGAVVAHARSDLGLRRMTARVFVENPGSAKVLRKLGFDHVDTERRHYPTRGGHRDVWCFRLGPAPAPRPAWRRVLDHWLRWAPA